jgi:hypothetical protein
LHFNCSSVQLSWRTPPAILNRERRAMLDRPAESFCFLPASRLFTIESTPQSRTFDGAFLSGSALSASLYPDPRRARYLLPSILLALCFHGLTNCFSRNPLVFITFCVAPWVSSSPLFLPLSLRLSGHTPPPQTHFLHQLTDSFFFALFSAASPFVFNRLWTLLQNTGVGVAASRNSRGTPQPRILRRSVLPVLLRVAPARYILGACLTARFP